MNTNYKVERFMEALDLVRATVTEFKTLHDGGLTYREVDEVVFGTNPGHHEDVSGKVMLATSKFSWLRRFTSWWLK